MRYPDHQSAVRARSSIRKHHSDRAELPTRAYQCEVCKGWHLTSWEN